MHSEDRKNCKVADFVQFRTISLAYIKYFLYLCTRFKKCSFSRLEQPLVAVHFNVLQQTAPPRSHLDLKSRFYKT